MTDSLGVNLCAGQCACVHTRNHFEHALHFFRIFKLSELIGKVGQGQTVCANLLFQLRCLFGIVVFLRLLNQREHIAHAENTGSHTVRMKRFNITQLFAGTDEFNRLAGDSLGGKSSAAAGVAVHFCHENTVNTQRFIKCRSYVDGVLTGHRIDNQHDFSGLYGGFDVFQLIHQRFINVQAACRVKQNQIIRIFLCVIDTCLGNLDRIALSHFENGNI